jgi:PII-like signaling protein
VDTDCIKLTSYFGGRRHGSGRSASAALIDLYGQHDIAAIIVLRGIHGSGRGDNACGRSAELPLTAIAIGTRPNIEAVLDQALELNPSVFTLQHGRLLSEEIASVGIADKAGEATRMTESINMASAAGRSSLSTSPKRPSTTASRSTAPLSAGCAPPGSAARLSTPASRAFTASVRRTAIISCG